MRKLATLAGALCALAVLLPRPAFSQEDPGSDETTAPETSEETDSAPADEDPAGEAAGDEAPADDSDEYADDEYAEGFESELECADGIDDDDDGDVDCDDFDCQDDRACIEEAPAELPSPGLGLGSDREDEQGEDEDELLEIPTDDDEDEGSWEDHPLDMFEIHGYLRVRADLFHKLQMHDENEWRRPWDGRDQVSPYPEPPIDYYACAPDNGGCEFRNNTVTSVNMRFRLEPIINLGDHVRILSQIDLLGNLVLGSTPEGAYYDSVGRGGLSPWVPLRAFSSTQVPPNDRNSLTEAISVRRAWAEVTTPFGQIHFGRMGSNWGMGMLANSGNRLDDDYGDTVDRIMLATRLWGILLVPGVEFAGTGATTATLGDYQGQPMNAGHADDVAQYFLQIVRLLPREEQEERMRRGDLVLNAGLYLTFRNQTLSQERVGVNESSWTGGSSFELGADENSSAMVERRAWALVPDLWVQLFYRGLHLEMELAYVGGDIDSRENDIDGTLTAEEGTVLRQFGGVVRGDYTALNGQLNVGLEFGYASGDGEVEGLTPRQAHRRLEQERNYDGSSVDSLFRFDPDFNVDLILFDMKDMDPAKHKEFTGVDNTLILENAKRIRDLGTPMMLRIPVVPSCNARLDNMDAAAAFFKDFPNLEHVELLPYHRLGEGKWERLGLTYRLKGIEAPSEEALAEFQKPFEQAELSEKVAQVLRERG